MTRRGAIHWIPATAVDPSVPGAAHPWLVVQDDVLNASRIPTTVVIGISSRLSRAKEPGNVLLEPGEGDLPQQSVVVSTQVSVVAKADLGERIGALAPERVDQVLAGLRFVQRSGR